MFGNIIENVSEAVDNTVDSVSNLNASELLEDFGQVTGQSASAGIAQAGESLDFGNIWDNSSANFAQDTVLGSMVDAAIETVVKGPEAPWIKKGYIEPMQQTFRAFEPTEENNENWLKTFEILGDPEVHESAFYAAIESATETIVMGPEAPWIKKGYIEPTQETLSILAPTPDNTAVLMDAFKTTNQILAEDFEKITGLNF